MYVTSIQKKLEVTGFLITHEISSLFVVVHRSISTDSTLVTHDNGSFSLFFGKKFLLTKQKAFCRYANVAKT